MSSTTVAAFLSLSSSTEAPWAISNLRTRMYGGSLCHFPARRPWRVKKQQEWSLATSSHSTQISILICFSCPHSAFLTLASFNSSLTYALPHLFNTIHTSISLLFLILSILLFKTTLIGPKSSLSFYLSVSPPLKVSIISSYILLKNVFLLFYLCDCVGPSCSTWDLRCIVWDL